MTVLNPHSRLAWFALWLAMSLGASAQAPQTLPPGGAAQVMIPQPPVQVAVPENFTVAAAFDPAVVTNGQSFFYRVSVDTAESAVDWPENFSVPAGLQFGALVRGQVTGLIGSQFRPTAAFLYPVTARQTGTFTVPEFAIDLGGRRVVVPAASVEVVPSNAPPSYVRRLYLQASETNLYYGQPFRLRVIAPFGPNNEVEALREIQLNTPALLTDKLTTRILVESVEIGGRKGPAFIQESIATPMSAGTLVFDAQGFTAGRDFGGPITISGQVTIVGGAPKYILVVSEPLKLQVRPLPSAEEWPGFTGAIGKFLPVPATLSTNRLRVGEPVLLKYAFSTGTNLTRFVPPAAPRVRDWQIIPGKPGENYFTLIPLSDELTQTPTIPFSAFDPATGRYYDLTLPAQKVTVSGESLPTQTPGWDPKKTSPLRLSDLAEAPGKSVGSLRPLQLQPWFVGLQLLPIILLLLLWRWDEHRRYLEAHPELVRRRQAKRALQRERKSIRAAIIAADETRFISHAAAALQIAVAPHYPAEAKALVGADVLAQLEPNQRDGKAGETVKKIFAAADTRFGQQPAIVETLNLAADVEQVLRTLEEKL